MKSQPLLIKTALAAHCPKCHRYQLVEKRHNNGKIRLSCQHKIRPAQVSGVLDVSDPAGPRGLVRLTHSSDWTLAR